MNNSELEFIFPDLFTRYGRIRVKYRGAYVGYANLIRDGSIATLADICIYDHLRPVFNFLPVFKIRKNYRGKGIGSALLKAVVEFCKKHNVSEIHGEAKGDLPLLIPWYKRHGFSVGASNKIYRNLCA